MPAASELSTSSGPPEAVPAMMISGNLFEALGVRLLHGDTWPLDYYRTDNGCGGRGGN